MITPADDYPIHQSPQPMARATDERNFYDRYFFNGYSEDGSTFFAFAMGFYPTLGVVDAAFCVQRDDVQHNVRASKTQKVVDRMDLSVGPLCIEVSIPLLQLKLHVDHEIVQANLEFNARCAVLEEPRFTRRSKQRLTFDYTRMTQNGVWTGDIAVEGQAQTVEGLVGTRDRSWGIRPVGVRDPETIPADPQFFWLWTPLNFADRSVFYHLNADGDGCPWNESGAHVGLLTESASVNRSELVCSRPSSRVTVDAAARIATMNIQLFDETLDGPRELELSLEPGPLFYMSGLGYTHPRWSHGLDHGELNVEYDQIDLDTVDNSLFEYRHVQAFCRAELTIGDGPKAPLVGAGVIEQLFIGRYEPLGIGS